MTDLHECADALRQQEAGIEHLRAALATYESAQGLSSQTHALEQLQIAARPEVLRRLLDVYDSQPVVLGADVQLAGVRFSDGSFVAVPGPDGWIKWPGGDCPIPAAKVGEYEVLLANGEVAGGYGLNADCWDWAEDGDFAIVAYRLLPCADTSLDISEGGHCD